MISLGGTGRDTHTDIHTAPRPPIYKQGISARHVRPWQASSFMGESHSAQRQRVVARSNVH